MPVYAVDHVVRLGETIAACGFAEHCGGKGFNQAIALARAGAPVSFAGAIGPDGEMLVRALEADAIDTSFLMRFEVPTGHAIIQVTPRGQNSIVVSSGANGAISPDDADAVLSHFSVGDWVVLQNEISSLEHILKVCVEKGMKVALTPSPFDERMRQLDLDGIDYLLINETEGAELTGISNPEGILSALHRSYPALFVVLTLGGAGGMFLGSDGSVCQYSACEVSAVDTTAAGDTFAGFFIAEAIAGSPAGYAVDVARTASALAVIRHGAACSIPYRHEVDERLKGD